MTQKKNIRIMKAGLLKDVQVVSTPQSRGEQPPVRFACDRQRDSLDQICLCFPTQSRLIRSLFCLASDSGFAR